MVESTSRTLMPRRTACVPQAGIDFVAAVPNSEETFFSLVSGVKLDIATECIIRTIHDVDVPKPLPKALWDMPVPDHLARAKHVNRLVPTAILVATGAIPANEHAFCSQLPECTEEWTWCCVLRRTRGHCPSKFQHSLEREACSIGSQNEVFGHEDEYVSNAVMYPTLDITVHEQCLCHELTKISCFVARLKTGYKGLETRLDK